MNCANHTELQATAFCRTCGKPLCDQCRRDAYGTVYCAEHLPAPAAPPPNPNPMSTNAPPYSAPYPAAAPPGAPRVYADVSPGVALFLGFIPGVGAIYNGQYAKGILHAVVSGMLLSAID